MCVQGMFWSLITVFLSVQICSMRNKSKTEGKEGEKQQKTQLRRKTVITTAPKGQQKINSH